VAGTKSIQFWNRKSTHNLEITFEVVFMKHLHEKLFWPNVLNNGETGKNLCLCCSFVDCENMNILFLFVFSEKMYAVKSKIRTKQLTTELRV
jgi:hypothetical protein